MYFAIYCEDVEDSVEKRRSVRDAHLARLQELKDKKRLLVAGPLLQKEHENPFVAGFQGSFIIAEFDNMNAAKAWAAADPYITADVYANVSIFPFIKVFPEDNDT